MQPEIHPLRMTDGAEIIIRRWPKPGRSRIFFSHGNGLASDCFKTFFGEFVGEAELVVFDLRNHGWNPTHELVNHTPNRLVADFVEVITAIETRFGQSDSFGVFHSISGVIGIQATLDCPDLFQNLVLFEPPICPPRSRLYSTEYFALVESLIARTARKRENYCSLEEFITRLRAHEDFSRLGQQELEILAHGLLRPEGGQMTLRCPRQFEAVLYNESFEDLYDRLNKVDVKTTVVAGGAGLARLELARDVAENGGFAFHEFEGCTHFMLMEEPKAISRLVRDVLLGKR